MSRLDYRRCEDARRHARGGRDEAVTLQQQRLAERLHRLYDEGGAELVDEAFRVRDFLTAYHGAKRFLLGVKQQALNGGSSWLPTSKQIRAVLPLID